MAVTGLDSVVTELASCGGCDGCGGCWGGWFSLSELLTIVTARMNSSVDNLGLSGVGALDLVGVCTGSTMGLSSSLCFAIRSWLECTGFVEVGGV